MKRFILIFSLLFTFMSVSPAFASPRSYASFSEGRRVEELAVEEKEGGLFMTYTVTNEEDYPYMVAHRDGQVYDIIVLDRQGRILWRWSDGMAFTMALTSSSVAPHTSAVYTAAIPEKDYKQFRDKAFLVTAWIMDTPQRLSTRVPKEIKIWRNL